MNVGYVEQHAHDLILNIILNRLKTTLKSFGDGTAEKNGITVEAHIIGESCYLIFTFDFQGLKFTFTEVCACIKLDHGEDIISLVKFKKSERGKIELLLEEKIKYKFEWEIFSWQEGQEGQEKLQMVNSLFYEFESKVMRGEASYIPLRAEFPLKKGGTVHDETIVTVEIKADLINVNSIHTYYPQHIAYTKSETQII